jgi:hypothetical protein
MNPSTAESISSKDYNQIANALKSNQQNQNKTKTKKQTKKQKQTKKIKHP